MENKKISVALGVDHRGFEIKEKIKSYLGKLGCEIRDFGTGDSITSVHYPLFAKKVCDSIDSKESDFGILVCGSGTGMCIAANRNNSIRAVLCFSVDIAKHASEHNNANVLCLAGDPKYAKNYIDNYIDIVKTFLETPFGNAERNIERLNMIENIRNE